MTALILQMPDFVITLHAAREVVRCEGSTRDQLGMAAEVLAHSPEADDRVLAREIRNAIWAQLGAELQPAAQRLATRLLSTGEVSDCFADRRPGSVAPHHAARADAEDREAYQRMARRLAAFVGVVAVLGILISAALATPAKHARTLALYHQIEEMNDE